MLPQNLDLMSIDRHLRQKSFAAFVYTLHSIHFALYWREWEKGREIEIVYNFVRGPNDRTLVTTRWDDRKSASKWRLMIPKPQTVWADLAKFCHFGKRLQVFGKFLTIYCLFGKMLRLLLQICDIIGLIFIVANGQIVKNNLTIWSHWWRSIIRRRANDRRKSIAITGPRQ